MSNMEDSFRELAEFLGIDVDDLKGVKGDRGEKGDPGKDGRDSTVPGPKGDKGDKGDRGPAGRDGIDGVDGRDGKDGKDGRDGKDGKRGPTGAQGPSGRALVGWGAHPLIVQDEGVVKDKITRVLNFKGSGVSVERTAAGVTEVTVSGGAGGSPAGSDTQVQFNDGGSFGADAHFTFNKTTDSLHVHALAGDATDGLLIESDNGTDIGRLGAANTANVTWYGNHNYDAQTADTIAGFGATKTLGSLSTATYPSLTELSYVKGVTSAIQTQLNAKAPSLGADDNYVTDAEKVVIGNTSGTNTGDQTSIVGITGTRAQFDTALTDGNFLYTGDITPYTDENAQDAVGNVVGAGLSYDDITGAISSTITQYTDEMAQDAIGNVVGNGLDYDDTTGAISVDETELAAASIGGFTEAAQDAVGAMVDTTLTYVDGTPLLQRAALTGHITSAAGSNATLLGSFTLAQLNTAVSDANIIPEAGGTFTGDISVPDEAYGPTWDGVLEVPTKNAVYDVINALNLTNITRTIVTTTGDVTMGEDAAVDYIYVRNSDDTITFPTAVGNNNRYTIKNRYTTPLTPRTTSSQTIDGRSQTEGTSNNALVIFPNEAYDFLSDGSNWYTI